MKKSIFPKRVINMIQNGHRKGLSASEITLRINVSNFVAKRGLFYTIPCIATKLGNITRSKSRSR
jgi:hypothetical protein